MKTFLRSGLLAMFLLCAYAPVSAHAQSTDDPMKVTSEVEGTNINLLLTNLQQETTTINISTIDGNEVFFTEHIRNHNGYSLSLQMEELPAGKYLLTVKKGETVKHQVIVIEYGDILLSTMS